jgi:hypothetical protein
VNSSRNSSDHPSKSDAGTRELKAEAAYSHGAKTLIDVWLMAQKGVDRWVGWGAVVSNLTAVGRALPAR